MPKISKILLLTVSAALVLTVFLGVNSSGVNAATDDQDGAYRQINVYSEVLRHIQTDYVVEPNIPQVTNGAMRGLLESLDADSSYLTADDYKAFKADKEKGAKAQVGINVSKRWGYATVVSIVPGSPADKVNLNDGDIIEAIDDHDTRDISLAMIRMMLEGAPGSQVSISVVRPRKAVPDKITMTRQMITQPATSETMYENSSILYLKPGILDREHVQQVESKLKGMQKAGNKKILLDLRDVAAGDIPEAIRMANFLLKSGTITILAGQKVEKQTFTAESSKAINTTSPVVVLVNRGTAGPAEVVAAALMDNHRADLVGEKTFGEGSQQKTFELPDGAALILSVAKYESPSGKKLENEGVTPGVLVASNLDDNGPIDDGDATVQTQPETKKPSVSVDDQLNKALDLLKSKAA
ncbi:S41 family peptidase [Edaphobacter albus]|uniref:S41 family peptidase n=1 Tax=Edaphobacter sp. 4G125 TaxID=2763071 RepID=UPI0016484147|nr:S41 family peptidase [Edaphobacter sp. 4G125]QNI37591.1 PDZ domain-containing protein [Edaphobacter sp. 4G125]